MTPDKVERVRAVLTEIAADMARDATYFDGKPFNGRTLAEYNGNQGAAIAALAHIVKELLEVVASLPELQVK